MSRRRTAFTLVEVMVVIAIIALLLGIVAIAGRLTTGKREQTRLSFQALLAVADEYEAQTGQVVRHGPGDTSANFVTAVMALPDTQRMLNGLGTEIAVDTNQDGKPDVLKDGWGKKLRYRRLNNPKANGNDPDLPRHPRRFFASSGEDKVFGVNPKTSRNDDLYSFEYE